MSELELLEQIWTLVDTIAAFMVDMYAMLQGTNAATVANTAAINKVVKYTYATFIVCTVIASYCWIMFGWKLYLRWNKGDRHV
jgi:ABC-type uncharacterized transport system permease subunit